MTLDIIVAIGCLCFIAGFMAARHGYARLMKLAEDNINAKQTLINKLLDRLESIEYNQRGEMP